MKAPIRWSLPLHRPTCGAWQKSSARWTNPFLAIQRSRFSRCDSPMPKASPMWSRNSFNQLSRRKATGLEPADSVVEDLAVRAAVRLADQEEGASEARAAEGILAGEIAPGPELRQIFASRRSRTNAAIL